MARISVIIPYFKKKNFIKKAINSVLSQSFKKFEIIIIYDDNNKKDLDFIKKLKNFDKRIKLIINEKNIGAGYSRNKGIKLSNAEYICFLDADDTWKKNKLKKQLEFMKREKIFFSHTSYEIINTNNEVISFRKARKFSKVDDLLPSCDIGLSTVMIKRSILNGLKFPKLRTKEDFVLWLKLLKKGIKIYPLDQKLTKWTKDPYSLSSNTIQKLKDGFKVYNQYMKFDYIKSLYFLFLLSCNYLKKSKWK